MKAALETISTKPTDSFLVKIVDVKSRLNLKGSLHFHPEFELIWTIKSRGRRFIGNHIGNYEAGELLFIGKNIPHCWITPEPSRQLVVQMKEDFLGKAFLEVPECYSLRKLFDESQKGILFLGKTRQKAQRKMKKLLSKKSLPRLLLLLDLLNDLAGSHEFEYLFAEGNLPTADDKDFGRIQALFDFVYQNFQDELHLEEAARQLNLTKSAFCRFVKRKTKKTFSQIVNEVRLRKAAELLVESDQTVIQVCYASGFNDPSHFFKQFSGLMGLTPRQFRETYRSK
jgi:AraC-like DNA-binding protein